MEDHRKRMTLNAVRPYPDELLTSALVRVCRHYLLSMDTLGRHFLGRVKWHPRFVGIPAIEPIADIFGMKPAKLLWEHTVFPYATAFLDTATYERAINLALGSDDAASNGALAQNAIHGAEHWRFCTRCVYEDMARYGESYWRRSHNLPGVWVCSVHETFLRTTNLSVALASRAPMTLPHEMEGVTIRRRRPPPFLSQISKESASLLQRQPGPPAKWSPEQYRSHAQANGWLIQGADLNASALQELVSSKCGRAYLEQLSLSANGSTRGTWSALMMRPGTKVSFVPLKHVILASVLSTPRRAGESDLVHRSTGPSGTDASVLDRFYSVEARQELRRMLAARETGLTTENFLRRVGCSGVYRHRGDSLPLLRKVVYEFRRSQASIRPIAPGAVLFRGKRKQRAGEP